jgi:hypothetical protein
MYRALLILVLLVGCSDCSSNNDNNTSDAGGGGDAGADAGDDTGFSDPFDPAELGWGLHVIGRSADDIYVAGGTPDEGRLFHYDGARWEADDVPAGTPLLNWVKPFDDGQVVVAGNGGTILWDDGSGWVTLETPTTEDLWGVWGASPDDVWAVGGRGREDGQATVLRYDGAEWTAAAVPMIARPGVNAWFKVWGSSANDVYVVGQNGGCLHYDGTTIEEFGVGTSEDLISVWGTGPDDVVLVGGRGNGVLAHFNGEEWYQESISPAPGVNGIWMPAPGEFWLAGVRGMLRWGSVVEDANGELSFDVPRTPPLSQLDLHAVYGIEGFGLMAVGGNFEAADGPYEGFATVKTEEWQ